MIFVHIFPPQGGLENGLRFDLSERLSGPKAARVKVLWRLFCCKFLSFKNTLRVGGKEISSVSYAEKTGSIPVPATNGARFMCGISDPTGSNGARTMRGIRETGGRSIKFRKNVNGPVD